MAGSDVDGGMVMRVKNPFLIDRPQRSTDDVTTKKDGMVLTGISVSSWRAASINPFIKLPSCLSKKGEGIQQFEKSGSISLWRRLTRFTVCASHDVFSHRDHTT
jgi:hypothetical protein